ncbi:Hpt domain-containing protein [Pseudoflavitalea sp. G-6-1-2]|uniref:Hpt domain-containing protein n=1 Tax=Pseudoflavitalea sp. G-6-1-2 TaxID=2728841 RepID=UPI00146DBE06|nr:Hpt domain-containing protein [Pseudoflavitalea sp. G-6-1-2]NML24035.1 Hpt domain-containing protein [Pseudoflavitalea sp. G-6-1-2]
MIQPGPGKNFEFSEKIDADYLFSLYADDYPYIEEVFSITLTHFDADLDTLRYAWASGNISELKKAAHKMKPAMGFAGLTHSQQRCQDFEEACHRTTSVAALEENYQQLITTLAESKLLIAAEYERLKAHNKLPLCP